MDETADQLLVAAVLAGDCERYADLVRRHHRGVCRMVAQLLSHRHESDEVVQDVFVTAYRSLATFDTTRSFAGWLHGIARNQVLMRLRTQRRAHRLLEEYRVEAVRELDDSDAGDAGHVRDERHSALQRCQEELSPYAAEVIALRYGQGLDLGEVAARLGRSLDATRQLLYRIRAQLRACVEARAVVR